MNSALGTQVRLTETSLKAITMLNDALSTIVPEQEGLAAEDHLTREEIMAELSRMKATEEDLQKHLEGTPSLDPIDGGDRPRERLKEGDHSYLKKPEVSLPPIPEDIPILAQ